MNKTLTNIVRGTKIAAGVVLIAAVSYEASHTYYGVRVAEKINQGFQNTQAYLNLRESYEAFCHSEPRPTFKQRKVVKKLYNQQYHDMLQAYKNTLANMEESK